MTSQTCRTHSRSSTSCDDVQRRGWVSSLVSGLQNQQNILIKWPWRSEFAARSRLADRPFFPLSNALSPPLDTVFTRCRIHFSSWRFSTNAKGSTAVAAAFLNRARKASPMSCVHNADGSRISGNKVYQGLGGVQAIKCCNLSARICRLTARLCI